MAQPSSNPSGRTPMSRAEAARHASLVRWKKEQPLAPQTGGMSNPKIRARVLEILAAKQKKAKPKGGKAKGRKGPDPAKAKAKAEREQAAAAKKQEREKAKLARDTERTAKQAARETARTQKVAERATAMAKKQAEQQKKLKQAARAKKEKEKVSAQAKSDRAKQADDKAKAAQEKADRDRDDLLASVADNPEKLGYRQAGDLERAGLVEKTQDGYRLTDAGRAKIAKRQKEIDAAKSNAGKALDMPQIIEIPDDNTANYTFSIKAGARHSRMDMQHIQAIHDSAVACGADCATEDDEADDMPDDDEEEGVKAIKGIMDNPLYYAQHECQDIMQAANALSTMAMLIQSELAEDDEDDAHIALLCDGARTLVKFISAELDELEGAAGDAADDARMGPMNKAIELDESLFAVKSIGDDGIMGPGVRYGSSDEPDISEHRDYFTKSTNYYLDAWDKRPMLWHHAVPQTDLIDALKRAGADQEEIKAMREAIIYLDQNPVIGTWTKAVADPAAVWMNGVLDRAHRYRAAIKRMVDLGMLKISTDSIPQMVRREKQSNGTNEVKCWPIVAASLTPQAAEPRLFDVQAIKAIYAAAGMDFPFAIDDSQEAINPDAARRDGAKAADDERARVLLLELDLLELETA